MEFKKKMAAHPKSESCLITTLSLILKQHVKFRDIQVSSMPKFALVKHYHFDLILTHYKDRKS